MSEDADAGDPEIGSAAEEAAKLLHALGDWASEQRTETASGFSESVATLAGRAANAISDFPQLMDQHLATGAPECTYCPVCRTVHIVREASPNVRVHLTSAAFSLLQAATTVVNAMATPGPATAPTESAVETIDLDDDSVWEDEK